jgi:hypothetical protein
LQPRPFLVPELLTAAIKTFEPSHGSRNARRSRKHLEH